MDGAILSVIGVGVALAAIIVNGQGTMRAEFRAEISGLRRDLRALGERVARIEGQLAGPWRFIEPFTPTGGEGAA